MGWKHLVFQIRGTTLPSEVSLPKASSIKVELHDPSCLQLFSYGSALHFQNTKAILQRN